ncbi:MAG: glycosyltransferase [Planctomycetes bacterium]|nr:glycosyltransferase [Planctomycetota bacterium]
MDVTVIIPARNAASLIGRCISALKRQSYNRGRIQIIAVDDGSVDGTAAAARQAGAEVLRLRPSGPAAARNRGAELASGEILLFTDADCIPAPDWIEKMVEPFADLAVTGAKGIYRTEQTSLTARFVQREYESRYRRMRRYESIDFADTYAAGFRRELFFRAGGYDESFPTSCVEDQEFSFRYSRLPGRMVFVPEAVVTHLHADRPWKYFRKKVKIGFWKARVMLRHPGKALADSHTPQSVKLEMLSVLLFCSGLPMTMTELGWWACGAALGCFSLVAAPLCLRIGHGDWKLGLASPGFLFLRALGLGIGTVAGGAAAFPGLWKRRGRPEKLHFLRPERPADPPPPAKTAQMAPEFAEEVHEPA